MDYFNYFTTKFITIVYLEFPKLLLIFLVLEHWVQNQRLLPVLQGTCWSPQLRVWGHRYHKTRALCGLSPCVMEFKKYPFQRDSANGGIVYVSVSSPYRLSSSQHPSRQTFSPSETWMMLNASCVEHQTGTFKNQRVIMLSLPVFAISVPTPLLRRCSVMQMVC